MESFAGHLVAGIAKLGLKLLWDLGPWGQAVTFALVTAVGITMWRDARSRSRRIEPGP